MHTNKDVYGTVEFDTWAHTNNSLFKEERFLFERYLNPAERTLEGGTAGGRILHALRGMGFSSLNGFDYVPEFIDEARRRDASGAITFDVQDATKLSYPDESFDQLIYLGQVICFIEQADGRAAATREAYRILRPGKTAIFSFLSFEARDRGFGYRSYLAYLRVLRAIGGAKRSIQVLPWLRLGGRFNRGALRDAPPYLYWYRAAEVQSLLESVGFKVQAAGSQKQLCHGRILDACPAVAADGITDMLYVVCSK